VLRLGTRVSVLVISNFRFCASDLKSDRPLS
jgi:hypothetical protein